MIREASVVKSTKGTKKTATNCEDCLYYVYSDDIEGYECTMALDEDEMLRFMEGRNYSCPYFRLNDEYATVRKQN